MDLLFARIEDIHRRGIIGTLPKKYQGTQSWEYRTLIKKAEEQLIIEAIKEYMLGIPNEVLDRKQLERQELRRKMVEKQRIITEKNLLDIRITKDKQAEKEYNLEMDKLKKRLAKEMEGI